MYSELKALLVQTRTLKTKSTIGIFLKLVTEWRLSLSEAV